MTNSIDCNRKTKRTETEKNFFQKRLKIIEGQVRGIEGMIEEDRYCGEILIQISAVTKALKSLGNEMLKNHLSTCVVRDIKENKLQTIEEVMQLIERLN